MNIDNLLSNQNYNSEYNFIINSFIREYDISKANINALYERNIISKAEYDQLYNSDKFIREKTIGLKIRKDQNIYKEIQAGIINAKRNLIISNNIDLENIVCIKNDAVFVLDNKLSNTKFGLMEFKLKNTYTLFLKTNKYEFYYYYNPYNNEEKIDIKGINDSVLYLHKDFFLDFLLCLFNTIQIEGIIPAINLIQNFNNLYINKKLDINYYREFNSNSNFNLNLNNMSWYSLTINNINFVDIKFNYEIIRDIYGILMDYYFKKIKNKR